MSKEYGMTIKKKSTKPFLKISTMEKEGLAKGEFPLVKPDR